MTPAFIAFDRNESSINKSLCNTEYLFNLSSFSCSISQEGWSIRSSLPFLPKSLFNVFKCSLTSDMSLRSVSNSASLPINASDGGLPSIPSSLFASTPSTFSLNICANLSNSALICYKLVA